jgi:hypothetical protein
LQATERTFRLKRFRSRSGKIIVSRQKIPQDRQDHDQQHGKDGSAPDAIHSKTSARDSEWKIAMTECETTWNKLFPGIAPFSGSDIRDM